jgi:hypothetical protein
MRARVSDPRGLPIYLDDAEPSVHNRVECAFDDRGNWYTTNMALLIIHAANTCGELFDPRAALQRPLAALNGRPC